MRGSIGIGSGLVIILGMAGLAQEAKEPERKRGFAVVEETRPKHFPHRIWAGCDFESQLPDYAWFGPAETKNIPAYPGNRTALTVGKKPYGNTSALMTGINPVPGPCMGQINKLYLRYYLKGTDRAIFQHFSLTRNDNNHIYVSGLTEGKWAEATFNFTRDARRNDGSKEAFAKGERMDDFKIFVGRPNDGKDYELVIDDVIFFDDDPGQPKDSEPFPNRVLYVAGFDTGVDAKARPKYFPGELEVVRKDLPADSYWGVAKAVPRQDAKGKWIRLQIKPEKAVGAHTKLRFRYHLTGTARMTVQIFDLTDMDNRHIHLKDLKQNAWTFTHVDFTKDSRKNDGKQTPFAAGHQVDDIFFFIEPDGGQEPQLLIDEVVLYDAGSK